MGWSTRQTTAWVGLRFQRIEGELEATKLPMRSFRSLPPSREGAFNITQALTEEKRNNVILMPHHWRLCSRLILTHQMVVIVIWTLYGSYEDWLRPCLTSTCHTVNIKKRRWWEEEQEKWEWKKEKRLDIVKMIIWVSIPSVVLWEYALLCSMVTDLDVELVC